MRGKIDAACYQCPYSVLSLGFFGWRWGAWGKPQMDEELEFYLRTEMNTVVISPIRDIGRNMQGTFKGRDPREIKLFLIVFQVFHRFQ